MAHEETQHITKWDDWQMNKSKGEAAGWGLSTYSLHDPGLQNKTVLPAPELTGKMYIQQVGTGDVDHTPQQPNYFLLAGISSFAGLHRRTSTPFTLQKPVKTYHSELGLKYFVLPAS